MRLDSRMKANDSTAKGSAPDILNPQGISVLGDERDLRGVNFDEVCPCKEFHRAAESVRRGDPEDPVSGIGVLLSWGFCWLAGSGVCA
jgi:hypothetical protein